ncbi:MAG: GNAT family N-acetyltransferase [Saprospiraceae bacterium]
MKTPNFNSFPTLSSARLTFRQLNLSDLQTIFRLRSDEIVLKYLDMPTAKNLKAAEDYIHMINNGIAENKWILWGLELKSNQELVGTICLWNWDIASESAELGYVLLPEYHRQGLMTEATKVVLDFGFNTLGFREIDGILSPENIYCIRILDKFGFQIDYEFEAENVVRYYLNDFRFSKSDF